VSRDFRGPIGRSRWAWIVSETEKESVTDQSNADDTLAKPREFVFRNLRSHLLVWLTVVGLLAVGAGVLAYLISNPKRPEGEPERDPGRLVRVLQAKSGSHRCSVTVYGTSRASQQWAAIAEVRGKAVEVNSRFEPGEILKADTLLVSIDAEEFTLAVDRLDAEARSQQQLLDELDKTEANLKEIRRLQEDQLELAGKVVQRQESLAESNVATDQDVEAARGSQLAHLIGWQETTNALALIPLRRNRAKAVLDAIDAQLKEANRRLADCEIRLPFDARCVSKSIEVDQYVGVGERLGLFLAMDTAEVVAMVETRKGASLFPRGIPGRESVDLATALGDEFPLQDLLQRISAKIHWGSAKPWDGKVTRIASSLDRDTRAVPVIIEVANPYTDLIPGVRPPLVPAAFCEVTLYGDTVDNVVLVPRDSLHEMIPSSQPDQVMSVVYLLAGAKESDEPGSEGEPYFDSGRLEIRPVSVLALEDDVAVIEAGIQDGDLVVLGDLFPAFDGMPLRGLLAHQGETAK
jgi:multidrug efflux pump subunit AcrA (membrane-fusion protein)